MADDTKPITAKSKKPRIDPLEKIEADETKLTATFTKKIASAKEDQTAKLVADYQKNLSQLRARKDDILAKKRQQNRKDDTRRKILVGAIVIERALRDPDLKNHIDAILRDDLKERDRLLFPDLFQK